MWKIIPGTENLYYANKDGQIKSADRVQTFKTHNKKSTYIRKGKVLKTPLNSHGYPCVTIKYLDGTQKVTPVHRLIALTFIPNPNNLPQINHKDGNKENNSVNNLEWCTAHDNICHAFKNRLNKGSTPWKGKYGHEHCNSKPVVSFDSNGNLVAEYESSTAAAKAVGLSSSAHISACLHGNRKTAGGYSWRFKC